METIFFIFLAKPLSRRESFTKFFLQTILAFWKILANQLNLLIIIFANYLAPS